MSDYRALGELDAALEQLLPESLCLLAQVIGLPAVLRLLERWPGVTIRVPMRPDPDYVAYRRLVEAVGEEVAQQIIAYMAGDQLRIPRASAALSALRDRCIQRDRARGASIAELVLAYGVSERTVYYALSAEREAAERRQSRLF